MATLEAMLASALQAYNAGAFAEAERHCRDILAAGHPSFEACHVLALVQARLGRHPEALASFDRAIALRPDHAETQYRRGITLHELKRLDEALAGFDRAVTLRPDHAESLTLRGNVLFALDRHNEALESYDRALALEPASPQALCNRGAALHALKRYEAALASHDAALAARPHYVQALSNRSVTLHSLERFEEALASADRAIALKPDYADAHNNRGNALKSLGQIGDALAAYDRALALQPGAEAHFNRGVTLKLLGRLDEALVSFDQALALQPTHANALRHRGDTLYAMSRFGDALASYDRAIELQPDYQEANWNQGLIRLLLGDFERGWKGYEWRWKSETLLARPQSFPQPLWSGAEPIEGKTILLHGEQGFGDVIQFSRYIPMVAGRGARVIVQVPRALRELIGQISGVAQVIAKGDPLPEFDVHCPLLSLPLAFGTRLDSIPPAMPYLRASPKTVQDWQARLGLRRRARIGLAWSGNPAHNNDRNRSLTLPMMLPLLAADAEFVSLQKNIRADDAAVLATRPDLAPHGEALKDFSDTAGLVSHLDLVISADTSVAHLAGAMGKRVWVLLPFIPDWRWLLDRSDSPWYPSTRLFRQDATRDWAVVITRAAKALREFVQGRR